MRKITYISDTDTEVKTVLKKHFNLTASVITALKTSGGIRVNGEAVTVRKKLNKGELLELEFPECGSESIVPTKGSLDILYEDEDILCVNKPSGMPTHPSQNHHTDTLANLVCYYYRDIPFTFRVSNRLDSYTSGVCIIAKNIYSASYLCTESFRRKINKTYYALCRNKFSLTQGIVDAPIARCEGSTIKREVNQNGKAALTHYRVIENYDDCALVELKLETGRTHQIRVHMAYIGHPLINDFLYDSLCDVEESFFLHCQNISFIHPITNKYIEVTAPMKIK